MSVYKGKSAIVHQPVAQVYDKISNLGAYQQRLESLPPELRAKLGDVRFTDDSIIIAAQPVGEITFRLVERVEPSLVKLEAVQSPVPFSIKIALEPETDSTTKINPELNVDIPAMLKPMVGGKLQEAADKFGDLISTLFA